jgi:hypothetical protein
MPVARPLSFPTATGVWERRRGVGRRIGGNINNIINKEQRKEAQGLN